MEEIKRPTEEKLIKLEDLADKVKINLEKKSEQRFEVDYNGRKLLLAVTIKKIDTPFSSFRISVCVLLPGLNLSQWPLPKSEIEIIIRNTSKKIQGATTDVLNQNR